MFDGESLIQRCALVKKIPVFASLNWFRVQSIARDGEVVRVKKGERVCSAGAVPDYVYFVIAGRLQGYTPDSDGNRDDVEFVHRGMLFGIISAMTAEPHSQTFEAVNDSVIFRIPVAKFSRILKKYPELGVKFSKVLSQHIRSKMTKTDMVRRSTIISVYSPIAGSGGSTYSLNLALSLFSETAERVILISVRPKSARKNKVVSDFDEVRPKWKIEPHDLKTLADDLEKSLPAAVIRADFGIDLLNVAFDDENSDSVRHISDFVSSFIDDYRYVIVDLPSDMNDVVIRTLSQSDLIYLIMGRRREALEIGRVVLNRLEEVLKEAFNEERVKVLISGVTSHRPMSEDSVRSVLDFNVLAFLPHIQKRELSVYMDTPVMSFWKIDKSSQYQKTLTRAVRQMSGLSVGLVLGGGAAFGLSHIGVLKVLEEEGIGVDIVAGSSMGALIGGLWALGHNAAELEKIAYEFRRKSSLVKLMDFVFPLSGLISGKAIMSWLRGKFGDKTFRDTRVPLRVVAYDLIHRRDIVIKDGRLVEAIRKSISIPGVFQPIVEEDQLIIDGGVMNPLPTDVLRKEDVKRLIAVNVLQSPEDVIKGYRKTQRELNKALEIPFLADPWNFIEIRIKYGINQVFFPNISDIIVRTLEASECVIAEQSARAADVHIHPDLSGLQWYELYEVETLIRRGEDAARAALPKIRAVAAKK